MIVTRRRNGKSGRITDKEDERRGEVGMDRKRKRNVGKDES